MHRNPEMRGTVGKLAGEAGLSRSGFAARFSTLVGEPPLAYLTRLRTQRASEQLRRGATVAEASVNAGYPTEASFGHALRQWFGVAPGVHRRRTEH